MTYVLSSSDFKQLRLTYFLIGINILSYIIVNIFFPTQLFMLMVQDNTAMYQGQKLWGIFTSLFTHFSIWHLFNNCLALLIFGIFMEKYYTIREYLMTYFSAGLIGSLASFVFLGEYAISAGASGCIFGLMALVFLTIPRRSPYMWIYAGYYFLTSFGLFGYPINYAHSAGIIVGFGFYCKFHRRNVIETFKKIFSFRKSENSDYYRVIPPANLNRNRNRLKKVRFENSKSREQMFIFLKDFERIIIQNPHISLRNLSEKLKISVESLEKRIYILKNRISLQIYDDTIHINDLDKFQDEMYQLFLKYEK